MKKRLLSLVLVMVMLVCAIPAQGFAATLRTWNAILQYDLNGGEGSFEESSISTNENRVEIKVSEDVPSKEGYDFEGWAILPNGPVLYHPGSTVEFVSLWIGLDKTTTLYAVWEEQAEDPEDPEEPEDPEDPEDPEEPVIVTYTVTFDEYHESGIESVNIQVASGTAVYVFMDYDYDDESVAIESFVVDGPRTITSPTQQQYEEFETAKENEDAAYYHFEGFEAWYHDENVIYFVAIWKGNEVEVKFSENDFWSSDPMESSIFVPYGEIIELDYNGGCSEDGSMSGIEWYRVEGEGTIEDPVKENCVFMGWEYDEDSFFGFDYAYKAVWKRTTIDESYKDCDLEYGCCMDNFYDVNKYSWYHEGAHFFISNDILIQDDSYFCPESKVTKEDLAVVLYKLSLEPEISEAEYEEYGSISASSYGYKACIWAISNGIIKGDGTGEYDLCWSYLTREEATAMIYRYECIMVDDATGVDLSFVDDFIDNSEVSAWARSSMSWMIQHGIIKGTLKNVIGPKANLTKAQLATIIVRLYEFNQNLNLQ